MCLVNPVSLTAIAPHASLFTMMILLCLMPDDFTHQWNTQWINNNMLI